MAEGFAAFFQRVVAPGEPGDDGAVRVREHPFAQGLDCDVVAQNGAQVVELAFFMGDRDQPPVAISGRFLDSEDRRGLSTRLSGYGNQGEATKPASAPTATSLKMIRPMWCFLRMCPIEPAYSGMGMHGPIQARTMGDETTLPASHFTRRLRTPPCAQRQRVRSKRVPAA